MRASFFLSDEKETKESPGAAHGHLTMPYPASPGPPFLFTGTTIKDVGNNLPARERTRTRFCAPTAAAQCQLNNLLLLQEATRLASSPRGGLGWTDPPLKRARDSRKQSVRRTHGPMPHPPADFVGCSSGAPLNLPGHCQPQGVHPIGGDAIGTQWRPNEVGSIGKGRAME